jgi:hypothetical protein
MRLKSNREARGIRCRIWITSEGLMMSTLLAIDINGRVTTELHERMR